MVTHVTNKNAERKIQTKVLIRKWNFFFSNSYCILYTYLHLPVFVEYISHIAFQIEHTPCTIINSVLRYQKFFFLFLLGTPTQLKADVWHFFFINENTQRKKKFAKRRTAKTLQEKKNRKQKRQTKIDTNESEETHQHHGWYGSTSAKNAKHLHKFLINCFITWTNAKQKQRGIESKRQLNF